MKKRIVISSLLCASLLCSGAYAAVAPAATAVPSASSQPLAGGSAEPAADSERQAIPYSIGVRAVVTQVVNEEGSVSIEVKPEDGEPIVLLVSDATVLVDNQNAIPVGVEDIKTGDTIYAYHSLMMTMSLPGQTPALAILTNLGEGSIAALHTPEQVQTTGNNVEALCDNRSILIRTADETVFTPYMTRQIVTAADIRMGQPFLAWYDATTRSCPAQTTAKRIMILPADTEERDLQLIQEGDMVIQAKMVDGTVVVPARLTAETLGLKVGYRREGNAAYVTIASDTQELKMTLGEDQYSCEAAPQSFGVAPFTAPYMESGEVTWMSAEAFELLGYDVSLAHENVSISKR